MAESAASETLVVFVQSERVIDQTYRGLDPRLTTDQDRVGYLPAFPGGPTGPRVVDAEVQQFTERARLSREEDECVRRAWRIAGEFGYRLRVVDARYPRSGLSGWLRRHRRELREFPVLLLPDDRRLMGPGEFTEQRLREALSRTTGSASRRVARVQA